MADPGAPESLGRLNAWLFRLGLEQRELRDIALAQAGLACAVSGLALLLAALPPTRAVGQWTAWAACGAWTGWVNFLLLSRTGARLLRTMAAQGGEAKPPTLAVVASILLKLFLTAGLFCALAVWARASVPALLGGFTLDVLAMLAVALLGAGRP